MLCRRTRALAPLIAAPRRLFATSTETGACGLACLSFTPSRIFGVGETTLLHARIFDTPSGNAFIKSLPTGSIMLQTAGTEVYGSLKATLPAGANLVDKIPPGGLAYSARGNYLCVFWGRDPAWPVDYIGQIDENWEALNEETWTTLNVTLFNA